jgi:inner membrane protein
LTAALLAGFARQHWRVALLCLVTFHLHLICDLIGSRGPTPADLWPIPYGEPFFRTPVYFWTGQWRLDGWQNRLICILLVLAECGLAPKRGFSCIQIFSQKADAVFVSVLQKWHRSFSEVLSTKRLGKVARAIPDEPPQRNPFQSGPTD